MERSWRYLDRHSGFGFRIEYLLYVFVVHILYVVELLFEFPSHRWQELQRVWWSRSAGCFCMKPMVSGGAMRIHMDLSYSPKWSSQRVYSYSNGFCRSEIARFQNQAPEAALIQSKLPSMGNQWLSQIVDRQDGLWMDVMGRVLQRKSTFINPTIGYYLVMTIRTIPYKRIRVGFVCVSELLLSTMGVITIWGICLELFPNIEEANLRHSKVVA